MRLDIFDDVGHLTETDKPTKTPWHLRFAPGALSLKEIAATTGIGTIYGLLFASLLFSPLMPHIEAQTSSTNLVPVQTPTTQAGGPGFNRAIVTSDGTVYNITSSTELIPNGAQVQNIWIRIEEKLPWGAWLNGLLDP